MMLVNFQTLLTYDQTKWLLSNWNGYDIAVNISPIIKRSVVIYKNNFYKYNGDIRIWEELDVNHTIEYIILRFFGDRLSQWRQIIGGQLFDDPDLLEHYGDKIRKLQNDILPAKTSMLTTVKTGIKSFRLHHERTARVRCVCPGRWHCQRLSVMEMYQSTSVLLYSLLVGLEEEPSTISILSFDRIRLLAGDDLSLYLRVPPPNFLHVNTA